MTVIGIVWDVVGCEVNFTIWYGSKEGESCFIGNMLPP